MKLYHGTKILFDEIDLSKAKIGKDFGKGFYLTTNYSQAKTWAKRDLNGDRKGYVIEYYFDELNLEATELKIKKLTTYNAEWVNLVVYCRLELQDTSYDIIYDRMADSKYNILTRALEKYYNGLWSINRVLGIASFADVNYDQYCFKTERVLKLLKKVKVTQV